MSDQTLRILSVQDAGVTGAADDALAAGDIAVERRVCRAADDAGAFLQLDNEGADVVLFELGAANEATLARVAAFRHRAPLVPIIVVVPSIDETAELAFMRAGADDCLARTGGLADRLSRAIRHAVERTRFQQRRAAARDSGAQEAEFGSLHTVCDPLPLPVTERSFGGRPLPERAAESYRALLGLYLDVLELALEQRRVGDLQQYDEQIDQLVNKLGALNAGPRDLIDLHKAAINVKLPCASLNHARAYIDEGRLMLLHVMGHLVSYYRALSWGRQPTARPRGRGGSSSTKSSTTLGNL